jgi:hypothetical protein
MDKFFSRSAWYFYVMFFRAFYSRSSVRDQTGNAGKCRRRILYCQRDDIFRDAVANFQRRFASRSPLGRFLNYNDNRFGIGYFGQYRHRITRFWGPRTARMEFSQHNA